MIRILQQIRHLKHFWKKWKFFSKNYFPKSPNFERFEKSYYFSRILQICYHFNKKFHGQKVSDSTDLILSIGKNRVKERRI